MQDLSSFDNSWYCPGRSRLVMAAWYFLGLPVVRSQLLPVSAIRRAVLCCFGARIDPSVVLKKGIRVKYPWRLSIGKHSWIGEDVWIDNLADVRIGENVCVSQGSYLCTGNHDWSDPGFGLRVEPIAIEDRSWVGARALLCPGVVVGEGAVAAAGSVVTRSIPAFEIHAGNPAAFVKVREFRTDSLRAPAHGVDRMHEETSSEIDQRIGTKLDVV